MAYSCHPRRRSVGNRWYAAMLGCFNMFSICFQYTSADSLDNEFNQIFNQIDTDWVVGNNSFILGVVSVSFGIQHHSAPLFSWWLAPLVVPLLLAGSRSVFLFHLQQSIGIIQSHWDNQYVLYPIFQTSTGMGLVHSDHSEFYWLDLIGS